MKRKMTDSSSVSTTLIATLYTITNIVTYSLWTLCNKYQFSKKEWHIHVPLAATSLQMFIAGLVAYFCVHFLTLSHVGPISRRVFWRNIVPLGLVRSTDIGFGNLSLTLVTVAFQQIIKSTIPVYVCVLSVLLLRKKVQCEVWASLLPIVGGTVLASMGEIGGSGLGLLFALISCGGRAFKAILNALLLNGGGAVVLDTYTILMYEAPLSGLCIGCVSMILEHKKLYDFFIREEESPSSSSSSSIAIPLAFNLFCGVLMFFNQLSYLSIIQYTSALTCQVLMNLKMVVLICVSVMIFDTPIGVVNVLGILVAASGCCLYARLSTPVPPPVQGGGEKV